MADEKLEEQKSPKIKANPNKPKPVIDISEKQRERWIVDLMKDYPRIDRMMAECYVDEYLHNPEYINGIAEGKIEPPPKEARNENYVYEGITVSDT